MDRFIMYPVAFVTTVQPWIALWVCMISFFLTMAVIALLSRGRTLKQLAVMSVIGYAGMVVVVATSTALFSGFTMVEIDVIQISPSTLTD